MNETGKIFLTEKLLTQVINQSQLSVGSVYFLLKDLTNQFEQLYHKYGEEEANKFIQQQQEGDKENNSTSQD